MVDVDGDTVHVDDETGVFEVDDQAWLARFATAHGVAASDLLVDESDTEACTAVKSDGDACGRDLPCPYHSNGDDEEE